MNETVRTALAAELAAVAGEALPLSPAELAYGRDLSCTRDLRDDFGELREGDPRIVLEALVRRFETPRGTLDDDEEYGFDLPSRLHSGVTQTELRALQSQCVAEAKKDERVDSASFLNSFSYETNTLTMQGLVRLRSRAQPFRFVLQATDASVLILAMEAA